ncbi:hypothetical protein J45TS6_47880 [Paenibacillus sp. J45TS6]|uniref:DUF3238 domain-containing protein n=1 Tax=Enterococcus aquimarinus TaxID=328396 RepID=A0A9E4DS75_9ENTE|nr:DUF3238 domain-containing protein [Paenibacillus sp. J45TS6]MCC9273525.1 DUF3238 domain-containing protein [Enterococcus aquimarinus]GIP46329.1 hypothetical protein J45TS6_47880 [Paenibacillus sp. J45TS6]
MAISFAVRIISFISEAWVNSPFDPPSPAYKVDFKGDNRTFSKDMENASYRTVQQINFKFDNNSGDWNKYAKTGITTERLTNRNTGKVTYSTGQASVSGITAKLDASHLLGENSDWIRVLCEGAVADPLIGVAPAVNYKFYVYANKQGKIELEGMHDGYPSFEVYAQVNGGTWQNIYLFEEQTVASLFPPMEIKGVYKTRYII